MERKDKRELEYRNEIWRPIVNRTNQLITTAVNIGERERDQTTA